MRQSSCIPPCAQRIRSCQGSTCAPGAFPYWKYLTLRHDRNVVVFHVLAALADVLPGRQPGKGMEVADQMSLVEVAAYLCQPGPWRGRTVRDQRQQMLESLHP